MTKTRSISIAMMVLSMLAVTSVVSGQTDTAPADSALAFAKYKVELARNRFESTRRLRQTGSASGREMRRAEYEHKMAQLELEKIQQPDNQQDIELAIAKLNFEFASAEFEVYERLRKKGSVSNHDFQRVKTFREIAELELEGKQHPERKKMIAFKTAVARHGLAKFEYELAQRLIKKGSLSRDRHDQFLAKLKLTEARLEQRKQELGARAKSIRQ